MNYYILVGTKSDGSCTSYLVSKEVEKAAKEEGMTLIDYIKHPGEVLTNKGVVAIVGEATGWLPDILQEQ